MSSHYVLPSNTSTETFPNNHASFYSTPIMNPLLFDGDWEVAVLNISHSNCINTLNKDTLKVIDRGNNPTWIKKTRKVVIPNPNIKTANEYFNTLLQHLNKLCRGIVQFEWLEPNNASYTFQSDQYFIHLDEHLSNLLKLGDVLTSYDVSKRSRYNVPFPGQWNKDFAIHIIPIHEKRDVIQLKKVNEAINGFELKKRFKDRITAKYPHIKLSAFPKSDVFRMNLHKDDGSLPMAIIQSKSFHERSHFGQNGIFRHDKFRNFDIKSGFEEEWSFSIYPLDDVQTHVETQTRNIHLGTELFQSMSQLVSFLKQNINHPAIQLKLVDNDKTQLIITSQDVAIELGKDMQDILAFDQSYYKGICNVTSSGSISLTRRINYFYIYSNIGEMIRIGDIEAPLLCHFPFNPKPCKVITERTFEKPMYVKLKHKHISQIDIGIYDDAGQLIPFNRDAITTLRLHFRRV